MSSYILPGQTFKHGEVKSGKYDLVYASAGEGSVIISFPGSAGIEMSVGKDLLAREFRAPIRIGRWNDSSGSPPAGPLPLRQEV